METAGMEAAATPKCRNAKTCAKVGDFDKTSITRARLEASGSIVWGKNEATPKAAAPPISGKSTEIPIVERREDDPLVVVMAMEAAAFEAPPATRIIVAPNPTR